MTPLRKKPQYLTNRVTTGYCEKRSRREGLWTMAAAAHPKSGM